MGYRVFGNWNLYFIRFLTNSLFASPIKCSAVFNVILLCTSEYLCQTNYSPVIKCYYLVKKKIIDIFSEKLSLEKLHIRELCLKNKFCLNDAVKKASIKLTICKQWERDTKKKYMHLLIYELQYNSEWTFFSVYTFIVA